jgi:hypothetical protein
MHWDQYGTQSYKRLKPWLDPISSGVTSLGSINKSSISIVSNDDESDIMMQYNNNELIVDSKFKTVSVSIYNAKGQLIESNNYPQGKNVLSTNLLSKGIYFANIVSINNSKSYKFVVQ